MTLIEDFEKKAITLLCADALPNSVLHSVLNSPESVKIKFTGAEYLLNVKHKELPTDRLGIDFPIIKGLFQGHELNFDVFIEAQTLCLECSNYSGLGLSEEVRKGSIRVYAT